MSGTRTGTPATIVKRRDATAARRTLAPATHPLEAAADQAAGRATGIESAGNTLARPDADLRVPASVDRTLSEPGQPLPSAIRSRFEPGLGCLFSKVRVHDDDRAARSARAIGAQAYSSGYHIVFGSGRMQPWSPQGAHLLAHELAHVAQHVGQARTQTSQVWRKLDISIFDSGSFTDAILLAYLQTVRDAGQIEDKRDSDDKARGVVRRWLAGGDDFVLEPEVKVLLIREMQSGFTGDDDERAILNLLENSADGDIETIFRPGNIDPEDLDDDFHGDEEDALRSLYDRVFQGGRKAALKGHAAFLAAVHPSLSQPYTHAGLRALIDGHMLRTDRILRDRAPGIRADLAQKIVRRLAPTLETQISALPPDQRDSAAQDLVSDRVQADSRTKLLNDQIVKAPSTEQAELLGRRQVLLAAEVLLLDLTMQAVFRDIAMTSPGIPADFQKLATPLDAAGKAAANNAITPMTADEVIAEATGAAPPPPPTFKPQLPDGSKYEDKVKARIPLLISEAHVPAQSRTKKEHDDPNLTRSMDAMQSIANQAKDEVDLVFGAFYDKKAFKAFQGDKRNSAGRLLKKGNLRDVWQVEEDRRKADPRYKKQSARFWLFYLIQNDAQIQQINHDHDASPEFSDDSTATNDEAKLIRKVGDPFVTSEQTRLFEIGRAWDAYQQGKDVLIQLFKDPDATADRRFLWDMYFTLMHEYLHKLAHRNYTAYADRLGGEHSTEGNTLIEGIDSLLTEVVWSNAFGRAGQAAIRQIIEPDAVKAGAPFDPDLLPQIPHRRYDTYEQAARLIAVTGIRNVYAAYFQGKVSLIGGP